jgi:hypothetical protein
METFGVFSRNIVVHDVELPICGVILISGETITDIVQLDIGSTFEIA